MVTTRLHTADLHDQFLFSMEPVDAPAGWQTCSAGGWHLIAHPSLPVLTLKLTDGTVAGLALGHIVNAEGRYVRGEMTLPFAGGEAPITADTLEQFIYLHGGRYIFVVQLPGISRIYLDPVGSLAAVWCRERRRIASTTSLLLHDEPTHPLFRRGRREFPASRPSLYFPADLTAVPEIHRVTVNHYLDLRTLEQTRHYPVKPYEEVADVDIPNLVADIHRIIQRQIGAVIQECGGAYLALTAGKDSRYLLACARPFSSQLECVTFRLPGAENNNPGNIIDCETAEKLARHAGFSHRTIVAEPGNDQTALDYLLRIGFAGGAGKSGKFLLSPRQHLDLGRGWITGHSAGIYKFSSDRLGPFLENPCGETLVKVVHLGKARSLPEYELIVKALDRWLEQAPDGPVMYKLQLAQIEHRVGAWSCPHLYGMAPFRINFLPVAHRDVIDGLYRLPVKYRANDGLTRDLLQLAWPALLDVPFNGEALSWQ